jgi:hypothetical protein
MFTHSFILLFLTIFVPSVFAGWFAYADRLVYVAPLFLAVTAFGEYASSAWTIRGAFWNVHAKHEGVAFHDPLLSSEWNDLWYGAWGGWKLSWVGMLLGVILGTVARLITSACA